MIKDRNSHSPSPETRANAGRVRYTMIVNPATDWAVRLLSLAVVKKDVDVANNWTATNTSPGNVRMPLFLSSAQKAVYSAQLAVKVAHEQPKQPERSPAIQADVISKEMDRLGDVAPEPAMRIARELQGNADAARADIAEIHRLQELHNTRGSHEHTLPA